MTFLTESYITLGVIDYVLGGLLILLTIGLTFLILKQSSGDGSMSASITGASSDTFFGANKGKGTDAMMRKLTIAGSVLFIIIAVALVFIHYSA